METVTLKVEKRDLNVKAKDYRLRSKVTLEYYGKGIENMQLVADYQDFRKAYIKAGKSIVLNLEVEGQKDQYALMHEVDYHPVTDEYLHIDLMHVDLNKELTTKIPLEFIGIAPAVKDLQGTLTVSHEALEVKCLAKDLVSLLEVDISVLEDFNSVIKVSDVNVPETLTLLTDLDDAVVTVTAPREEEEELPVEAAEGAEGAAEGEEGAEGAEGAEAEGGEKKEG